jgi:hypothetical protein
MKALRVAESTPRQRAACPRPRTAARCTRRAGEGARRAGGAGAATSEAALSDSLRARALSRPRSAARRRANRLRHSDSVRSKGSSTRPPTSMARAHSYDRQPLPAHRGAARPPPPATRSSRRGELRSRRSRLVASRAPPRRRRWLGCSHRGAAWRDDTIAPWKRVHAAHRADADCSCHRHHEVTAVHHHGCVTGFPAHHSWHITGTPDPFWRTRDIRAPRVRYRNS